MSQIGNGLTIHCKQAKTIGLCPSSSFALSLSLETSLSYFLSQRSASLWILLRIPKGNDDDDDVQERALQNVTNLFIVSLAVADLCVAGVVMPFYVYTMVSDADDYYDADE